MSEQPITIAQPGRKMAKIFHFHGDPLSPWSCAACEIVDLRARLAVAEGESHRLRDEWESACERERTRLADQQRLEAHLGVMAPVVEAARRWDGVGAGKVMHVLTCLECKRLEGAEDRWCSKAAAIGREQIEAARHLHEAVRALDTVMTRKEPAMVVAAEPDRPTEAHPPAPMDIELAGEMFKAAFIRPATDEADAEQVKRMAVVLYAARRTRDRELRATLSGLGRRTESYQHQLRMLLRAHERTKRYLREKVADVDLLKGMLEALEVPHAEILAMLKARRLEAAAVVERAAPAPAARLTDRSHAHIGNPLGGDRGPSEEECQRADVESPLHHPDDTVF